ncbi:RNA-directed DNA polymerase, eukaryota [Tanacetum coccineum]
MNVNGVRFVDARRNERRTTQNSGICSPGPDEEMYYGQLEQILEFSYLSFKTVLFRVKMFDTSNKGRMKNLVIRNNITQMKANGEAFKNDQYILATQVKQCFFLEDMAIRPLEDDPDVIHVDNSSDLALSTSLNDLEIAALHIDGQSIDVDAPPDIIDVMSADVALGDGGDGVVMIVPLNTTYPPVVGVAWATEVRAPENPIWVAGERAGSMPTRRPETSG